MTSSEPEPQRGAVVRRFLERYFADEERGEPGDLAHYQRLFPGHDATLAAAWAGLVSGTSDGATPFDAPSDAATVGAPAVSWEGRRVGHYELGALLGEGGQGVVHEGVDTRLNRAVAVKLLTRLRLRGDDTRVRRFRREAELAARLDDPGLCPVFDAGVADDVPYLVMPRLEGETLARRLAARGPLSPDAACELVEHIARALHTAHLAGVVHRDIKPANVLVTSDDRPVLMDFGIARDLEQRDAALTLTGELLGTVPYMAPEQLGDDPHAVDPRADVHALGVLLFECLTGRLPFDAPTQRGLIEAITRREAPDARRFAPGVPRDLAVVLALTLAKEPEQRMRSAEALADELRRVRERRPIESRPATVGLRLRRWVRREPRVAGGVLSAFALLVAGLAVTLVLLDRVDEQRGAKQDALVALQGEADARQAALEEVRAERDAKQAALDDIAVLADMSRIDELLRALPGFAPPRAERVPEMRAWLDAADALLARLPLHEQALAELEAQSRAPTDAELAEARARHPEAERRARNAALFELLAARSQAGEGAEAVGAAGSVDEVRDHAAAVIADIDAQLDALTLVRFDDERQAWRHALETQIVESLRALARDDAFADTTARVRAALTFAESVDARSLEAHAAAWERVAEELADDPRFAGFELAPRAGLVPLGRDPTSGLQEFAHLLTGEPPARDADTGRLLCGEDTGVVFVLVPGGESTVGCTPGAPGAPYHDPLAQPGEFPPARVELSPFLISKYELTQGQWQRATGGNPSSYIPGKQYDAAPITLWHPVESISWSRASEVLGALGLALPTSAQWEHATRAGTHSVYPWGDDDSSCAGRLNALDRALERLAGRTFGSATAPFDDGFAVTAPPGSFPANAWGLHEVLGNVAELCVDDDHRNETPRRPGDGRVLLGDPRMICFRGGSSRSPLAECRSAFRTRQDRDFTEVTTGARPVFPLGDA